MNILNALRAIPSTISAAAAALITGKEVMSAVCGELLRHGALRNGRIKAATVRIDKGLEIVHGRDLHIGKLTLVFSPRYDDSAFLRIADSDTVTIGELCLDERAHPLPRPILVEVDGQIVRPDDGSFIRID